MNTEHTPAPWVLDRPNRGENKYDPHHIDAHGPRTRRVVSIIPPYDGDAHRREDHANAVLIASAPDLLAALDGALAFIEDDSRSPRRRQAVLAAVKDAIAKATTL